MSSSRHRALASLLFATLLQLGAGPAPALAGELPTALQAKVDGARQRLMQWAADPAVVAAVREANSHETAGMNNGKWADLAEADPAVKAYLGTRVSQLINKWESADNSVNKMVLRDLKGNLVGASVRPLVFNNASRPSFANPIKGQAWSANEIKPDPTSQVPSVQLGVPVMDGGKAIGVLHAAVTGN